MKKSAELGDEREVKLKGISGSESVFYNTVSGQHILLEWENLVFVLVTVSSISIRDFWGYETFRYKMNGIQDIWRKINGTASLVLHSSVLQRSVHLMYISIFLLFFFRSLISLKIALKTSTHLILLQKIHWKLRGRHMRFDHCPSNPSNLDMWRHSSPMVSVLTSRSSELGLSPCQGRVCVVFFWQGT